MRRTRLLLVVCLLDCLEIARRCDEEEKKEEGEGRTGRGGALI